MPYSTLADKKTELIRKAKDGSVFIAPITATAITDLTTTASSTLLSALPTGYRDLGYTTTDGVTFGRATEISEVNSFGSVEPTRTDVISDTITLQVTAQEHNIISIGLYTGADIDAIEADATTGEVQISKPDRPAFKFYRCLALFVDDGDAGEIYIGRWMPRVRATELGEQQFNNSDEAIGFPITLTGYKDSTLGFSHQWIFAGPGWKALLDEMDIPNAA